jgi:hypothetical protein
LNCVPHTKDTKAKSETGCCAGQLEVSNVAGHGSRNLEDKCNAIRILPLNVNALECSIEFECAVNIVRLSEEWVDLSRTSLLGVIVEQKYMGRKVPD